MWLSPNLNKIRKWSCKITGRIKMLDAKSDDLSSIPMTYMVERKNQCLQIVFLISTLTLLYTYQHSCIHTQINNKIKRRKWAEHLYSSSCFLTVAAMWSAVSHSCPHDLPTMTDCTLILWDKISPTFLKLLLLGILIHLLEKFKSETWS